MLYVLVVIKKMRNYNLNSFIGLIFQGANYKYNYFGI